MFEDHPAFECPGGDTKIWRYMDLARFLSILESRSLYFSRADNLGDPYEYAIPKRHFEFWNQHLDLMLAQPIEVFDPNCPPQFHEASRQSGPNGSPSLGNG
jgi:hypothetical protein